MAMQGATKIGVVGLGYVGLPLLLRAGSRPLLEACGYDTDERKLQALWAGRSPIDHVSDADVERASFRVTDSPANLAGNSDAIFICVPTPLKNGGPDYSFVEDAISSLGPHLHQGQVVIVESTVGIGATRALVRPLERLSGLTIGGTLHLAMSPEREDPGGERDMSECPKVVGGMTAICTAKASGVLQSLGLAPWPVGAPEVAEASKLLENTFRLVNIGLVNEFKATCLSLGVDHWEAVEAAATKSFGFMSFEPGPGVGGHCIPVDPVYLQRSSNAPSEIVSKAIASTVREPRRVASRVMERLGRGSVLLTIGLSYKRDLADTRESPAPKVVEGLLDAGASRVDFYDPVVTPGAPTPRYEDYDGVVILTDHQCIDWDAVLEGSRLIFDSRGVFADVPEVIQV